jgi:predicted lipid-binding transport protein (Tim44 family)
MTFSMIDVTLDHSGRVVDGSPAERVTVREFWSFQRTARSRWSVSAIQES